MPIISSIHIHILSDLQIDVRKHSTEEKIAKTIPGAAGEKKICAKTEKKKKRKNHHRAVFGGTHSSSMCASTSETFFNQIGSSLKWNLKMILGKPDGALHTENLKSSLHSI